MQLLHSPRSELCTGCYETVVHSNLQFPWITLFSQILKTISDYSSFYMLPGSMKLDSVVCSLSHFLGSVLSQFLENALWPCFKIIQLLHIICQGAEPYQVINLSIWILLASFVKINCVFHVGKHTVQAFRRFYPSTYSCSQQNEHLENLLSQKCLENCKEQPRW